MQKNIRLLYAHNLLSYFRFHEAFLVVFFEKVTGAYTSAMSVLAVSTVAAALFEIPTGIISDRVGRKRTIMAGSFCATLMMLFYAFSHSFGGLCLGAIFSGLSSSLYSGNNQALLYESLKAQGLENQFHHYQGRTESMFQLGLGLSAVLASFLTVRGLQFVFILGIFPQLIATLLSAFFDEPKTHHVTEQKTLSHLFSAVRKIYQNSKLRLLIVGQAISNGVGESSFNFNNAFVYSLWPAWAVAVFRALNHGLGFIGFWFAGKVVEKIKGPFMMAVAEGYWLVTQTVAAWIANGLSPVIFLTGAAFYGPFVVARDQVLQKEFTDEQRATMGSVSSFAGSIVFALNSVCIGAVSDRFGLVAGVFWGTFACGLSLPIYVWLFRKHFIEKPTVRRAEPDTIQGG